MNGTFQLIRRAKREGMSIKPPRTFEAAGGIQHVRETPSTSARFPDAEPPVHTAIYRDLMQKFDRVNTRHLKTP
jgi:hypothetical protein